MIARRSYNNLQIIFHQSRLSFNQWILKTLFFCVWGRLYFSNYYFPILAFFYFLPINFSFRYHNFIYTLYPRHIKLTNCLFLTLFRKIEHCLGALLQPLVLLSLFPWLSDLAVVVWRVKQSIVWNNTTVQCTIYKLLCIYHFLHMIYCFLLIVNLFLLAGTFCVMC